MRQYVAFLVLVVGIAATSCKSAEIGVPADKATVTGITVTPTTVSLEPGGSQQLTVGVQAVNGASTNVTFVSSDLTKATVSTSGVVNAVAVGNATITVRSVFNTSISTTVPVTVTSPTAHVTGVTLTPSTFTLTVGDSRTLTATVQGVNNPPSNVTFTSSDNVRATVSAAGVVTAVSPGGVTITARSTFDPQFAATSTGTISAVPRNYENEASNYFRDIVAATTGATPATGGGILPAMLVMSFENASALPVNGMGAVSNIPRQPLPNSPSDPLQQSSLGTFQGLQSVARASNEVIGIITTLGYTSGSTGADERLRAWTFLSLGISLGDLALAYDSLGVPQPLASAAAVPPLQGYREGMQRALDALDSAVTHASLPAATAAGGFPTPASWLDGTILSASDFVRLARSYKARFRAGVARTPAERTAVDWPRTMSDADAGIASDFAIAMNPALGWDVVWLSTSQHFKDATFHQMSPYILGMSDVSGGYDTWLATPRDQRNAFLIVSPDLRMPQGTTRAVQNAQGQGAPTGTRYFRNRDASVDIGPSAWRASQYDHVRWYAFAFGGRIGSFTMMSRAELDLLSAEGFVRQGNYAAAAARLNAYRFRNGLPVITAPDATTPIPGGASCVPRVPVAPLYTTTLCGNLFEAIKYEKRMETAYTGWGQWYFDGRGWGDLVQGTAMHFPVPNSEMLARGRTPYTLGGVSLVGGAGSSTYGFGEGNK